MMRRKLLSHMLQGLESRAVYDYVASHKGVCALEHDGFFSYKEVTDWSHPCKRKLTAVCSHQTRIGNLDAHLI
ncbi:hypothetical protein ELV19_22545 [Escherichia coli]|nr:hypothetical protein ELX71_21065 [Escherichia coli]TFO95760.1 hypothetical protein ELV19_22545 [Escherichia coli]